MLQWNSKLAVLVVVALLIAVAAIGGVFGFDASALNITW
jgi:hypothetical protein